MWDRHALAAEAIHFKQDLLGEAVDTQDQVSAAYRALGGSSAQKGGGAQHS